MTRFLTCLFLTLCAAGLVAQEKVNPIVKGFGGIYDVPTATVKPEADRTYNIVVDLVTGAEDPASVSATLDNVARMINLHAVGGVPKENIHVVLAIHGGATFAILNDERYQALYGVGNPNAELVTALDAAGVRLTVCGQSLIEREIPFTDVLPEVEIATSMLTTVATYQLRGYAVFRF